MNQTMTMTAKDIEAKKLVNSIAMMVVLISFTMLFASMLLAFAIYRLTADTWPPMGLNKIALTIPMISTLVIALSSITLVLFEESFNKKSLTKMRVYFSLTFLLGLAFMAVQMQLWSSMKSMGLEVSGGVFQSLFFALTWTHAAHIIMGLIALLFLFPVIRDGYSDQKITWVQNISKFWHFLGVVWLVMFIVMFVL